MSVNIERLKQVRAFIEKLPPKACDMTDWQMIAVDDDTEKEVTFSIMKERGFECGSAACIAGWTELMANELTRHEAEEAKIPYISAEAWLELDDSEHQSLFCGFPDDTPREGWKSWMLRRMDDCIDAGVVLPYYGEDDDITALRTILNHVDQDSEEDDDEVEVPF